MEIKDIINIAAIVLSPIIAVLVTIFLQNRSDKKKEKIKINRRKRCWKHETSGCTAPEKAAGKLPIKVGIFMVKKLRGSL